ncbi:unnamed protein product [Laminaria digitata]
MAGRGREMTLPAWMTKEGGEQQQAAPAPQAPGGLNDFGNGNGGYPMAPAQGQFTDPPPPQQQQQQQQPAYAAPPPQQQQQQQQHVPPPAPAPERESRRRRSPSPRRDRDRDRCGVLLCMIWQHDTAAVSVTTIMTGWLVGCLAWGVFVPDVP